MKRLKKQHFPVDLAVSAQFFEKINNKQIVGHSRVVHPGQDPVNKYTLEDGSEVLEDDNGQPVEKWPELPAHVIAKRAEKAGKS